MIKLRSLLFEKYIFEASKTESVQDIRKWFYECMNTYFPEYRAKIGSELQEPKFVIKRIKSVGLYSSIKNKDGTVSEPTITLHPDFIATTGRSTTFHETIHYVQSYHYNFSEQRRSVKIYGGHDAFFDKWMTTMNASEGAGYITVTQTRETYKDVKTGRKFWVYAALNSSGDLLVTHSKRFNEDGKRWLNTRKILKKDPKVYMFETDEFKYQLGKIVSGSIWTSTIKNPDLKELEPHELEINV